MKFPNKVLGILLLLSVLLVGFVTADCAEAAKKKRFKFTRITDAAYSDQWSNFRAMISGDGKKVLYSSFSTSNEKNSWGLYLVNADGTDSRLIAPYKDKGSPHINNVPRPLSINYDGSIVFYSLAGEDETEYYVWFSYKQTSQIKPCTSSPLIDTDKCLEVRYGEKTYSGDGYSFFFVTSSPWNCIPAQGTYGNWFWYCEDTSERRIYAVHTDVLTSGDYPTLWLETDELSLPDHDTRFDPSIVKLFADKGGRTLAVLISYMPEEGKTGYDKVAMLYFIDEVGKKIVYRHYFDSDSYRSYGSGAYISVSPNGAWIIYEKRSVDRSTSNEVTVYRVGTAYKYKLKLPRYSDMVTVDEMPRGSLVVLEHPQKTGGFI